MSHHLDSPLSRQDPRLNVTDNYVFDSPTGTVFVMIVNTSLAGEAATPGFHPEARYEFKVHLDRSATETRTYRFGFSDRGPDNTQSVTLHQLDGDDARSDSANGQLIAEGRTGQQIDGPDGVRVWAGPAADPFYLDLRHLAFIIKGLQAKTDIEIGDDWTPATAASTFAGSTIFAIVLEVPTSDVELRSDREIGVWSVTKLATDAGGWHQTNRAAIPMMWPLFRAVGDADDEEYHRDTHAHPADDLANDGPRITDIITAASRNTGTRNPEGYAATVVPRLLPDLLPYTVGTPAAFGFAGFNGRALSDNAPEVMYSLITNTGFPTGFTAASASETRTDTFPYVKTV